MNLAEFSAEMTRRGCASDGTNFCGTFNNYPFAITFMQGRAGGATTFQLRMQFSGKVPGKLHRTLRKSMKPFANVRQFASSAAGLLYLNTTVAARQPFGEAFDRLMAEVTALATSLGLFAPAGCPICKQPGCDSYAYHGAAYIPVHAGCVQAKSFEVQEKVRRNASSGSYGLGFLGALLGAAVGMLPTVLLLVFGNLISGWLCALIPLGAYYGYKLLRGKLTRATIGIVILASVIMAPVVHFASEFLYAWKDYGYVITMNEYIRALARYPEDFIPAYLQILLFTGIGIVVVSGIISRTNTHAWNEASYSAATLRPMAGFAPAAPAAMPPAFEAATVAVPAPAVAEPLPAPGRATTPQQVEADIEMR